MLRGGSTLKFERSSLYLVLSNLATIVLAVVDGWSLSDVMWIYWGQSVVIGFFNWRRMLHLRRFSTAGMTFNDAPVAETRSGKIQVATFFAVHYGFFHFIYFFFLVAERSPMSGLGLAGIAACIAVFIVNHRFSFRHNLERDLARKPNIGTMMFFPYARIIPMHLTIIFGNSVAGGSTGTLVLFLGLKTLADLVMHMIEHRDGAGGGGPPVKVTREGAAPGPGVKP